MAYWIWHGALVALFGYSLGADVKQRSWGSVVLDVLILACIFTLGVRTARQERAQEERQAHRARINGGN